MSPSPENANFVTIIIQNLSVVKIADMSMGAVVGSITLFTFRFFGVDFFPKLVFLYNYLEGIINLIFGYKRLLVFTDCDDTGVATTTLKAALDMKIMQESKKFKVVEISDSENFLKYPLTPFQTYAIVFLVTDVSTLSSDVKKRDKIQARFIKFCQKGGLLILGHDALYRRSKNDQLQKLAGCKLTNFVRVNCPISYRLNKNSERKTKNENLLSCMPESLELEDREYVYGKWQEDVEYLYTTEFELDNKQIIIPVVTRRTAGAGVVCWVHSGDHDENGPPKPISEPTDDFITLIWRLCLFAV